MATPQVLVCSEITYLKEHLEQLLETDDPIPEVILDDTDGNSKDYSSDQVTALVVDPDLLLRRPFLASRSTFPNLTFVQLTWAGVDQLIQARSLFDAQALAPMCRLAGGVFGPPMSEYVLAAIISIERNFLRLARSQRDSLWAASGYSYRTLTQLTIGVLGGAGDIGSCICERLRYLGAKVVVLRRQAEVSHTVAHDNSETDKTTFVLSDLPDFLSQCDYLVNVLPNTPQTSGLLNGDAFQRCRPGAIFINVGRGTIASENSITRALDNGWLSFAWLDVFAEEPLPQTSPLWEHDRVLVTPHVSAKSRAIDVARAFHQNWVMREESLCNVLDWERGY